MKYADPESQQYWTEHRRARREAVVVGLLTVLVGSVAAYAVGSILYVLAG